MRDGFYAQTRRVEGRHWWFVHRRRLVAAVLGTRTVSGLRRPLALDLGCGTGGNLPALARLGFRAVGVDRSALALDLAREADARAVLVRAEARGLSRCFEASSFDLVTIFNVLYHRWVEDEISVLRQVCRILKPGGLVLATEPAFEFLRRRHDRVDFGARRFTRRTLSRIVEAAGLEVLRATYFNALAFVPAALVASFDALGGRGANTDEEGDSTRELQLPPALLNRTLLGLCGLERWWIRRVGSLPLGVGILLLARRP